MKLSKETETLITTLRNKRGEGNLRGNELARGNETIKLYDMLLDIQRKLNGAERDADPAVKVDSQNAVKKEGYLANAAIRLNQLRDDLARTERNLTDALQRFYGVAP